MLKMINLITIEKVIQKRREYLAMNKPSDWLVRIDEINAFGKVIKNVYGKDA